MLPKFLKFSFLLMALAVTLSCGKKTEQEIKDAIQSANFYLSKRECQQAIDLLESVGRQTKNSYYLKALASSYACRAGYSTTKFFADDIKLTASPGPLGGMTTYSTSLASITSTLSADSKYQDLQTAIDILLYAGGIPKTTEPSLVERAKYFSADRAGDINSQIAYMLLVQTGKFMKYYADTNASGVKGGGSGSNTCFTDYTATDALVQAYLATGNTGACSTANSSHPQLAIGATDRRKKLCEGVVLLNNILNVLPGVLASAGGGDLDDVATITGEIEDKKADLEQIDPTFGPTATVLSQTNCENDTDITEVTLSSYYAVFFESLVH